MEYKRLSIPERMAVAEQRAKQLELEHYQNSLMMRQLRAASGSNPLAADQAQLDQVEKNLAVIESALQHVEAEIEELRPALKEHRIREVEETA